MVAVTLANATAPSLTSRGNSAAGCASVVDAVHVRMRLTWALFTNGGQFRTAARLDDVGVDRASKRRQPSRPQFVTYF